MHATVIPPDADEKTDEDNLDVNEIEIGRINDFADTYEIYSSQQKRSNSEVNRQ